MAKHKTIQAVVRRKLAVVIVAIGIFMLGWVIGSGRIGPDSAYKKSVQKDLPADLDYSSVEQVYDALKQSFDGELDATKLLDGIKQGMAQASGDTYTEYFNAEAAKKFEEQLSGSFTGIGAELSKKDNNLIILAPLSGFPAEKAGLRAQDIIIEIDGQRTGSITVSEAVTKIRGPKGTKVKLKVFRGGSQELDFEITRDDIKIPSISSKILDGNIGYMKISQYTTDSAELALNVAKEFKQKGVKGIVLDVRNNPGGVLEAAVDISGFWLKNKTVLTERRNDVITRTYNTRSDALLSGIPTIVLINGGSASASEITAGALKDQGAATLMGEKSFGKGSVQSVQKLAGGAELKVTIARWYTPGGKNIDKQGIEPDKEVKFTEEDANAGKDPQLEAAQAELNK